MKVFNVFIISIFLSFISPLNKEEFIKNQNFKNVEEAEIFLQEQPFAKSLSLLTEEVNLFQRYILATLEDEKTFGDPNCLNFLADIFRNNSLPTLKLIKDSSHSLSKLGSFHDCKYKIYYDPSNNSITSDYLNSSYILYYNPSSIYNPKPTLFGVCIPYVEDCQQEDFLNLLNNFNLKTEFLDTTKIGGVIPYILNDDTKKFNKYFYIGLIIIFIFVFILLSEIFPYIPLFLFKCCFKKDIKESNGERLRGIYDVASLSNFKKSFDLKESIGEIYGVESNSGINNDSGISFLKGLRGICLMFFILGQTLEVVYQYPVQSSEQLFFNNCYLSILYFFNRFTKNLFLSISSFSLCYKILSYLDNEIENQELKNVKIKIDNINPDLFNETIKEELEEEYENKAKKRKISQKSKDDKSSSSLNESKNSENINDIKKNTSTSEICSNTEILSKTGRKSNKSDLTKMPTISQINSLIKDTNYYNKISFKSLFVFIFRQFYKYFLFISIFLIFRFSYYDIFSKFSENPMWEFIKLSFINKIEYKQILAIIFLYLPFYHDGNQNIVTEPYNIIILEISLFLIFSFILFIIYKTNIRFDLLLILMAFLGILIKLLFYLVIINVKNSIFDEHFYPSKGFTNSEWKFFFNNIFYYIPCISIGLFFGLVNYAIQKSAKDINQFRDKYYLSIPIKFLNILRKKPKFYSFLFSFIFIILFIWCGLSYNILFLSKEVLYEDSLAKTFYENKLINIYYSIDVDIVVFSIFLTVIPYNLIGENYFISFLRHEYWNLLSKPYYSYMLILQLTGINILYRMNTNVELNIYCLLFFSIINFIFGIIIGALIYTFFEVPLKKLNKFILSKKDDNKNEEDNEDNKEINNDDIHLFDIEGDNDNS